MGLRGPAKKPTALAIAQGNPGKRPINEHEPKFAEGEPDMPAGLSPAARRIWKETVAVMLTVPDLLTIADAAVLADYCEVRAQKEELQRAMRVRERENAKAIIAQTMMKGQKITAAEAKALAVEACLEKSGDILNKLRHRENVLRRELGLSPSARSSIRISGAVKLQQQNAIDVALFGGRPRLVAV
jgi:phage terminase small subunit